MELNNKMNHNVLILGAGPIGRAIGKILSGNPRVILEFWDKDSTLVENQKNQSELFVWADFVFMCVPSFAVNVCSTELGEQLKKDAVIVSISKGMDSASGQFVAEVLSGCLDGNRGVAMLLGPMLAAEIVEAKYTAATCATDSETFQKLKELFRGTKLGLEFTEDMLGASITSVLKNIFSMTLGIAEALDVGANLKGVIFTHSLIEMRGIVDKFGGNPDTVYSLCGTGDMFATGSSSHSRNRTFGYELVNFGKSEIQSEGRIAIPLLYKRLGNAAVEFPLLSATYGVINKELKPSAIIDTVSGIFN